MSDLSDSLDRLNRYIDACNAIFPGISARYQIARDLGFYQRAMMCRTGAEHELEYYGGEL
ncbi:hypothetical protein MMRN_38720 [Mycobacterium marinum]|uniref:hypothetical protein n=1 Tax=Mycobacterium marinum TaxID=1781 RepID=UPI000CD9A8B3|nr:hypothetical protein [Mycobacterium marinum]AXN50967.1 hypothetical protein CCUG20998_03565 [Mycobacterium marinum]RFZ25436.1 hypothetical protein DSM43519_01622 [Mycobacterium marinum]RFZ28322.1 hypothetical protein DSM44344_01367 [Mycobacterium marinum]RFZ33850.1 hypothetical protein NCTC2275_02696 [Mycobacterium marinum]WOR03014.1 hypothetical protein QDR78_17530 [Mycobacterium marinum]